MKKILTLILLIGIVTSCNSQNSTEKAESNKTEKSTKKEIGGIEFLKSELNGAKTISVAENSTESELEIAQKLTDKILKINKNFYPYGVYVKNYYTIYCTDGKSNILFVYDKSDFEMLKRFDLTYDELQSIFPK